MSLTVMWRSLVLVVVRFVGKCCPWHSLARLGKSRVATERGFARPRDQPRSGIPSGGKYYSLWSFDHAQGATSRRPMSRPDLTRRGGLRPKERRPPSTPRSLSGGATRG